jgi:ring-1,2-phenylacetyl-CoA epoxidase subunit PaaC
MQVSIQVSDSNPVQYLLRTGDTCLILAQRLGEWCGHAPVLEEDIALANMALDLLGQSRALLTRAGELEAEAGGEAHDEDQLAFLRDERDYRNITLVELPRGDFAFTVVRNLVMATLLKFLWERLQSSSDAALSAIAGKAVKEARYHQQHAADWCIRLGDGTDESKKRMQDAVDKIWPYTREMFEPDAVGRQASVAGLGPCWSELQQAWSKDVEGVLQHAGLQAPALTPYLSTGKQGRHSEHMGFLLADLQYLQRAHPGGVW